MNISDNPPSVSILKKQPGLLGGLRRTFAIFLRHPQSTLPAKKETIHRKNMTLPRITQSTDTNEFDGQILVTERLIPTSIDTDVLRQHDQRRFSAFTETPEPVRAELIRLDKLSGGYGEALPREARFGASQHTFCAIPLELDTFCDYCNQPIWGLGWGPVCRRCAGCLMTCHWLCADKVIIPCEVSPFSAHTYDDCEAEDENEDSSVAVAKSDLPKTLEEKGRSRTPMPASIKALSQSVLRPNVPSTTERAVSMGEHKELDPHCTSTPFHPEFESQQPPNGDLPPTLRPRSQFSLFTSPDTSLKFDETLEEIKEDTSEESEGSKATRHQSMMRSRRRHHNYLSTSSSRRHTTGISLLSVSTRSVDTYDVSSLDQRDLRERGLSVWQLSPAEGTSTPTEAGVSEEALPTSVVMSSKMQSTAAAALTGYQTGADGITYAKVTIGPRNAVLPWKPVELAKRLAIFNENSFGLYAKMTPKLSSGDCEGQIRLYINLIRPVRMVLTDRPASIFDIVGGDSDSDSSDTETQVEAAVKQEESKEPSDNKVKLRNKSVDGRITSFRLPRGSSKLLHVHLCGDRVDMLHYSFQNTNCIRQLSVRKLFDDESPLGLMMQWTLDSSVDVGGKAGEAMHIEHFNELLGVKRIVLQENETGDIEWSCFSEAQLRTFLEILNREEADYRRRIELKYQIRKREILRLMNLRAKCQQRTVVPNNVPGATAKPSAEEEKEKPRNSASSTGDKPEGDQESIDSVENGRNADTFSPLSNPPGDIPLKNGSSSPISIPPIVHDLISPQKATTPLNSNQAQLLTKAQQKKKIKGSKKGGKNKKLKGGNENGGAAVKPKSHHLWLAKKKKKSFEVANGVEA
nr:rassf1 [Hymenolepis microstoma]